MDKPLAICLMGPTATGKTDLAVELTRSLPCDIVSVDSSLVYRGMDIGTAKPDPELLAKAPHRLIDIRDPAEPYSAADFRKDALREMEDIVQADRIPLLVGGTMLYFKVLCEGIAPMPGADTQVRNRIQAEAEQSGWQELHRKLQSIDPEAAEKIHPNNPQRLMRALEVYELTGIPLGEHWRKQAQSDQHLPAFRFEHFAIAPQQRNELHQRIEERFRLMLDQGFLEEVEVLYRRGDLSAQLPALRAVGYRQVWQYLEGSLTYDEMVERAIIATRQLAKRQLTWLRSWPQLHWLRMGAEDLPNSVLKILGLTPY